MYIYIMLKFIFAPSLYLSITFKSMHHWIMNCNNYDEYSAASLYSPTEINTLRPEQDGRKLQTTYSNAFSLYVYVLIEKYRKFVPLFPWTQLTTCNNSFM